MSESTPQPVPRRVESSAVEEVRRTVFCILNGRVSERDQSRIAAALARELRDAGVLRADVEEYLPATVLAERLHRSARWVVQTFCERSPVPRRVGDQVVIARPPVYGPVHRDGGGWLIPASTVHAYMAAHVFGASLEEEKAA